MTANHALVFRGTKFSKDFFYQLLGFTDITDLYQVVIFKRFTLEVEIMQIYQCYLAK